MGSSVLTARLAAAAGTRRPVGELVATGGRHSAGSCGDHLLQRPIEVLSRRARAGHRLAQRLGVERVPAQGFSDAVLCLPVAALDCFHGSRAVAKLGAQDVGIAGRQRGGKPLDAARNAAVDHRGWRWWDQIMPGRKRAWRHRDG